MKEKTKVNIIITIVFVAVLMIVYNNYNSPNKSKDKYVPTQVTLYTTKIIDIKLTEKNGLFYSEEDNKLFSGIVANKNTEKNSNTSSITEYNEGKKIREIIKNASSNKITKITSYNEKGEIEKEEKYNTKEFTKNSEYAKTEVILYEDGNKKNIRLYNYQSFLIHEENYKDGKLHGDYFEYYYNGNIGIMGKYEAGKEIGHWKYFINKKNKEQLEKEILYNGSITEYKTYYKNGKIKKIYLEKDKKFHGNHLVYYENGNLRAEEYYYAGIMVGHWKYYYEDGKILRDVLYGEDIIKTDYYSNGNIESISTNKNSQKEMVNIIISIKSYYEDGTRLKEESFLIDDKFSLKNVGILKNYYKNGNLLSEETYDKGNKISGKYFDVNGNSVIKLEKKIEHDKDKTIHYFPNGNIEKIEEGEVITLYYENGKINGVITMRKKSMTINKKMYYRTGLLSTEEICNDEILTFKAYYPNGEVYTIEKDLNPYLY